MKGGGTGGGVVSGGAGLVVLAALAAATGGGGGFFSGEGQRVEVGRNGCGEVALAGGQFETQQAF